MPKLLKFMLDFLIFIMGLFIISGLFAIPEFFIPLFCYIILKIPTIIIEYITLKPYIPDNRIKKSLFQMNMLAMVTLMPLFFLALIVQGVLIKLQKPIFHVHVIGTLITVLLGLCESYIQFNFIKQQNLTTHSSEVRWRLHSIFILFWILFYIVTIFSFRGINVLFGTLSVSLAQL